MSDIFTYLNELRGHLVAFLSAGPFLIDSLVTWFWPWGRQKLDTFPHRRSLFLWIIIGGVFLAGFLTWQDEHTVRTGIEHDTANAARHLTDEQKSRMAEQLRLSSSDNYKVEFNSVPNCEECEDYAQELREFVSTIPGWKSDGSVLTFGGYPYRMGLRLFVGKKSSAQVAQKLVAAFASASIPLTEAPPRKNSKNRTR